MINYKNYVITPNENGGYVLNKKMISKTKNEEYLMNICYPSTLKCCFERILKLEFDNKINSNEYTIKEALDELSKINEDIKIFMEKNIKESL